MQNKTQHLWNSIFGPSMVLKGSLRRSATKIFNENGRHTKQSIFYSTCWMSLHMLFKQSVNTFDRLVFSECTTLLLMLWGTVGRSPFL
jgi:hypothetical protein